MRLGYFDCFAGANGGMILASLLDAGLSIEEVRADLATILLPGYDLQVQTVIKNGIVGSQIRVNSHNDNDYTLLRLREMIELSHLNEYVQNKSIQIIKRLADAEARVRGTSADEVHFDELDGGELIIYVVGTVAGMRRLGIERIYCSALHVGTSTAASEVPLMPSTSTMELLKRKPAYATGVQGELLTSTGAAILTTLASEFGPMPAMTLERVGYGAGASDSPSLGFLRLMIGEAADPRAKCQSVRLAVIETSIDDMNPQLYDHIIQTILGEGALDVFLAPIQMKKNRPGTLVKVVCREDKVDKLAMVLLRETTTIGLRWRIDNGLKTRSYSREVLTRYGPVKIKIAEVEGRIVNATPEYEDCKQLALRQKIPLREIMADARLAVSSVLIQESE